MAVGTQPEGLECGTAATWDVHRSLGPPQKWSTIKGHVKGVAGPTIAAIFSVLVQAAQHGLCELWEHASQWVAHTQWWG